MGLGRTIIKFLSVSSLVMALIAGCTEMPVTSSEPVASAAVGVNGAIALNSSTICPECQVGPETVVRDSGEPVRHHYYFPAAAGTNYMIDFEGGGEPGAAVLAMANGRLVHAGLPVGSLPIALEDRNDLVVAAIGAPGSSITFRIRPATPVPEPALALASATVDVDEEGFGGGPLVIFSVWGPAGQVVGGTGQAVVSEEGSQTLFLLDSSMRLRGLTISTPGSNGPSVETADAASTALALLMLSPGLAAPAPDQARARINDIRALPCFDGFMALLAPLLRQEGLHDVIVRSDVQAAAEGCLAQYGGAASSQTSRVNALTAGSMPAQQAFEYGANGFYIDRPSANVVDFENRAWRWVSVFRADGSSPAEKVNATSDQGLLPGPTPLSLGSLFSSEYLEPGSGTDPTFSSSSAPVANYYAIGMGWLGCDLIQWNCASEPAYPDGVTLLDVVPAYLYTTFEYVVAPVLSQISGLPIDGRAALQLADAIYDAGTGGWSAASFVTDMFSLDLKKVESALTEVTFNAIDILNESGIAADLGFGELSQISTLTRFIQLPLTVYNLGKLMRNLSGVNGVTHLAVLRNTIIGFGGDGSGWTLNGYPHPAAVSSNVLHITDVTDYYGARSAFFDARLPINHFTVAFTYQNLTAPGTGGGVWGGLYNPGDGFVFTLQNQGRTGLGDCCGQLGYYGIHPAAGVAFHIFSTAGYVGNIPGTGYAPLVVPGPGESSVYIDTSPVNLVSGDPIAVVLTYDGNVLTQQLTDLVTQESFTTTYVVDIVAAVGDDSAFVGFVGGTGAGASDQRISGFHFMGN